MNHTKLNYLSYLLLKGLNPTTNYFKKSNLRKSRKKKEEKPAFFDLLFKFNQNCRIDFVNDSENNFIDKYNEYYVDGVSHFGDEDRAESDGENDSDEEEESNLDDDEYSGVDDSDDG